MSEGEVAAVIPSADKRGSCCVWEKCTIQTGRGNGFFFFKNRCWYKRSSEVREAWLKVREYERESTQLCLLRPIINRDKHYVTMAITRRYRAWHNPSGIRRKPASWMTSIRLPTGSNRILIFSTAIDLLWLSPAQIILCLNLFLVTLWSHPGSFQDFWKCFIMIQLNIDLCSRGNVLYIYRLRADWHIFNSMCSLL